MQLLGTLLKAQPANFVTALPIEEVEQLLLKKISPLMRQSLTSDGLVGRVKRESIVIYRYKRFGTLGGIPGKMMFCGRMKSDNGGTNLEGQFQLSAAGRIFIMLWLFFGIPIAGWIIARFFFLGSTKDLSIANEAITAVLVLIVGFSLFFFDSRRFQMDIKTISASINEALRTTSGTVRRMQ